MCRDLTGTTISTLQVKKQIPRGDARGFNKAICLWCSPFLTSQNFSKFLPLQPESESPGLLFNLQTRRLHPDPLNQNLQGQSQEPVFNKLHQEILPD